MQPWEMETGARSRRPLPAGVTAQATRLGREATALVSAHLVTHYSLPLPGYTNHPTILSLSLSIDKTGMTTFSPNIPTP